MKAAIIVATKNRPRQLELCLKALDCQDHDDFSVVVVDNGGTVDLDPVLALYSGKIEVLNQPKPGPAAARNAGVQFVDCDIVAFTDDDCLPDPNWLSTLAGALQHDATSLVGGKTYNQIERNIYSEVSQTLVDFLYEYYEASRGLSPYFTSNNLACMRDTYLALGGFDETFPIAAAEDRDLGMRWREAGCALTFVPEAKVRHAHHLSPVKFWRQHSNYGRGARHLHHVLEERQAQPVPFEGFRFYQKLLTYPMRDKRRHAVGQSALLFVSQFATALGYCMSRDQHIAKSPARVQPNQKHNGHQQ